MCWAFDVSIAILTPFTRRASQHGTRESDAPLARRARRNHGRNAGPGTRDATGNGDGGDGRAPAPVI